MTVLRVGAKVTSPNPDPYLTRRHGVIAGETVGTVVRPSAVHHDDNGWLVNWGAGGEVRCNPDELELVTSALAGETQQIVIALDGGGPSLVPNPDGHLWGHFEDRTGVSGAVTYVPRHGSGDLVLLAMRARDAGYTVTDVTIRCSEQTAAADAKTYADIVPDLLRLGQQDAVFALIEHGHLTVSDVTVQRDGTQTTFGRLGRYVSSDDTAYREVFVPYWQQQNPEPTPPRPTLWQRFTGSRP